MKQTIKTNNKKRVFVIILFIIVLLVLALVYSFFNKRSILSIFQKNTVEIPTSTSYGSWTNVKNPKKESNVTLQTFKISAFTKLPLKIQFPLGAINIEKIFCNKDIWTKNNLPVPGVILIQGKNAIHADFGCEITLDWDEKLRYASFRETRQDGLFDTKAYKVLGEQVIKSTKNELEETKEVVQYRLELPLQNIDIENPIINVNIVSENIETGQKRNVVVNR